jgi:hypothetical protein
MKIIFVLLIIIVSIVGAFLSLSEIIKVVYNWRTLHRANKYPYGVAPRREGLVYNNETNELEADQSPITPF